MKARDLRELGREGLQRRVDELERDSVGLREAIRAGKEKNHARLSLLRKDVARARTVLHELSRSRD